MCAHSERMKWEMVQLHLTQCRISEVSKRIYVKFGTGYLRVILTYQFFRNVTCVTGVGCVSHIQEQKDSPKHPYRVRVVW